MPSDKQKALVDMGLSSIGTGAGTAVGFLLGGPVGSIAGSMLGPPISAAFSDMADRILSDRQKARVGGVGLIAVEKIQLRIANGDSPRTDNFFTPADEARSTAEELFEGTMLSAASEHEEKKLRFVAYLYSNILFEETCSRNEANWLLMMANSLTYSQYVALALIGHREDFNLSGIEYSAERKTSRSRSLVMRQIFDLSQQGLVRFDTHSGDTEVLFSAYQITPSRVSLSTEGRRFYDLCSLCVVPSNEVTELAQVLGHEGDF